MTICVVDERGGGLGSRMMAAGLRRLSRHGHRIIGLGLNRVPAHAMARADATSIKTAPLMIHRRLDDADLIVGSLSLLMPGSMSGEVTTILAKTLLESPAKKMLLRINQRKIEVVGAEGP
ncbi:MAG TPA: DUF3842 family protein [Nitrospira sp.]|jgi:hypothetical protein|nr:DUF3842 family protein [Nitrospira sp.]